MQNKAITNNATSSYHAIAIDEIRNHETWNVQGARHASRLDLLVRALVPEMQLTSAPKPLYGLNRNPPVQISLTSAVRLYVVRLFTTSVKQQAVTSPCPLSLPRFLLTQHNKYGTVFRRVERRRTTTHKRTADTSA